MAESCGLMGTRGQMACVDSIGAQLGPGARGQHGVHEDSNAHMVGDARMWSMVHRADWTSQLVGWSRWWIMRPYIYIYIYTRIIHHLGWWTRGPSLRPTSPTNRPRQECPMQPTCVARAHDRASSRHPLTRPQPSHELPPAPCTHASAQSFYKMTERLSSVTLNHSSCYSAQLFSTELQCSTIFTATVLMHPRCYNAHHFNCCNA
jgi:hypothetical protein